MSDQIMEKKTAAGSRYDRAAEIAGRFQNSRHEKAAETGDDCQDSVRRVPEISVERNSMLIDGITFGFSAALLAAALAGALYTHTGSTLAEIGRAHV